MTAYILAPMEGLTDFPMRHVLTQIAQYDWCVTEFLRVTDKRLPKSCFIRHCPELLTGSKTASGTPVHLQLLGSDPGAMAANAARAAAMGIAGIDINFGCPAKTVNRHRGGAALLDEPELLHAIVAAVRKAVPPAIPVSAKIRLGSEDCSRLLDNAAALHDAGADWLTIHGRTRAQGYRPPVDWQAIGRVKSAYPAWRIVANGDITDGERALACRQISGCDDLMLGRAAVIEPDLVMRLRDESCAEMSWPQIQRWQLLFLGQMQGVEAGIVGRYKQWLAMTAQKYPEALQRFHQVKRLKHMAEIVAVIESFTQ